MRPPRVAFQGELGAFSEEAVRAWFAGGAEPVPYREFKEVGEAVAKGAVDFGLLPVENSLAGTVTAAYDVLGRPELVVIGEVVRPVRHCLLGPAGAALEDVRRVLSHPVALAQCTRFLSAHPEIEAVAFYDTAGAAKEVAEMGHPGLAAIAARGAADRYGLDVLAEDIQDRSDNQTRFLVVGRQGEAAAPPDPDKLALVVTTENRPGALVQVLTAFAKRGINLSKLESRPGDEPWTYRFFVELETGAGEGVAEALEEVRAVASGLRVLGRYRSWGKAW